ncbi:MAG: carboxypeptidase regulatory-like domain-containing protein [Phycisphaerae bacterium]|nr:carboxypeptidase regulatory-like domain-containing protein [Phycisphaerae bacterium]
MRIMSSPTLSVLLAMALGLSAAGSLSRAAVDAARTGSITGKVVDSGGHGVAGALVRLIKIPRNVRKHRPLGRVLKDIQPGQTIWAVTGITRTANDGTFTVNNAPAGRYRIVAMLRGAGMGRLRKAIHVSTGESTDAGTIVIHRRRHTRH